VTGYRLSAATALCLLIGLTGASPTLANDTTIACKSPPKESASVAFHPGTQVTYTQDKQSNTCTFSVNGAVATSPPAEQVMNALNLFRSGGKLPPLDDAKTMASAIAALLASAAPVDKVPDDLVGLLIKADKRLTGCLTDFFNKKALPTIELNEIRFICRGLRPYGNAERKRQLVSAGESAVSEPTLMISVEWNGGRFLSALFLPQSIVAFRPLPR
jgi:hypothetical protein